MNTKGNVKNDNNMRYTKALRMLFEIMEGRPDIKEVKFNKENDTFEVVDNNGTIHICFGNEFRD